MTEKRGLQKATIAQNNLPPVSIFSDGSIGHYVRYRITSKDRNRFSHWSPIYTVKIPPFTLSSTYVAVTYTASSKTVSAVWGDEHNRPRYDVFVRWGNRISSVASSSYTRTITTLTAHNFVQGDKIRVYIPTSYVNYGYFNGTHTITSVTSNTITFSVQDIVTDNPETPGSPTDLLIDNPVNISTTSLGSNYGNVAFNNYYYHGTPSVHNYSFLKTGTAVIDGVTRTLDNYDIVHVDVQVESIEKVYNTDLLIYDSPDNTGYVLA